MRKCKIIATIGPSSHGYDQLEGLIKAGANIFRLNFSHGTHDEHKEIILRTREISKKLNISVGILQDLQGPKIRIGILDVPLSLAIGDICHLVSQGTNKTSEMLEIPVDFPNLSKLVNPKDNILVNDGQVKFEVLEVKDGKVKIKVVRGGTINSHKGINIPGICLDLPTITMKDKEDLLFGLAMGVDAVAISFVRSKEDVLQVRQFIENGSKDQQPLLIAKLEKAQALDNLKEIIAVCDGVMIARGDLGVEIDLEDVPVAQKRIIRTANEMHKLVITATQMLESMLLSPSPTRAEASDVANAIFDGTDMVMLSGETAIGAFPIECVATMDRIICQSESAYQEWGYIEEIESAEYQEGLAMVRAARELANEPNVAAIAVFTRSGRTANLMAKIRPQVPILAFTPEERIYQRLSFFWGVIPQQFPYVKTVEEMIKSVEIEVISTNMVSDGQHVIMIFGYPIGAKAPPNMAFNHKIRIGS
jgi:pyruvate kinase